eukprot:CAMPEP_0115289596 /NCGR_PEP_ID=MMETSP0270-20121206/63592_1 /TAXON_ID=71861 /ORGANISM="Scrippsiella trochoidea, Strain CCMP3099" /LENGTH=94 /DNA_ID=CAMNT_0002706783 /DNA_START=957 /DNA_END=1237 /DNA_ORIENTATION=+
MFIELALRFFGLRASPLLIPGAQEMNKLMLVFDGQLPECLICACTCTTEAHWQLELRFNKPMHHPVCQLGLLYPTLHQRRIELRGLEPIGAAVA